jgi:hypothetical protein
MIWWVVSTPLKNISQLGLLFPIYGKIKNCSKPPTSGTLLVYLDHEMDKKSSSRKCPSGTINGGQLETYRV